MGKPTGFLEYAREKTPVRPIAERRGDWREVYLPFPAPALREQGARCMDCGVPFCHNACPLGNLVPDWNDFAYRDKWREASERLAATNNFPELTGRLCPAPCESSCVLALTDSPVNIKGIEQGIADRAFDEGWIVARPPGQRTGKRIAVVGSGPAGLAAADQLNKVGHHVRVFERDDRPGGLLRYGIPDFKLQKSVLDRRLALLRAEGIELLCNAHVGVDIAVEELRREHDALVLACGTPVARDLNIPGRELDGIHYAMAYLTQQNRLCAHDALGSEPRIDAAGKRVLIIGGGDTAADCLGTAHRQGALSVQQIDLWPRPPRIRDAANPWPQWAHVFRMSPAHEEGGERLFAMSTQRFVGENGTVAGIEAVEIRMELAGGKRVAVPVPGSAVFLHANLVLLALGFSGPETGGIVQRLGLKLTPRGTVQRDAQWMTSAPGVFVAGDMTHGQSLIVWAIAEGRSAARGVDTYLMGQSELVAPV